MKRLVIIFSFTGMSLAALLLAVSCSNQANPSFVAPLQTVTGFNPTYTATCTFTSSPTPTPTPPFPAGGFNGPYGLAVDSKNNIYVGDTGNSLIKQYVNGFLNTSWPSGKVKANGLSYPSPKAITTDAAGNIYVVGSGNAVSKYDTNGNYITQYTTTAAMSGPLGVACSGTTLYVSDTGNKQIVMFPLPGGAGVTFVNNLLFHPYGLAFDNLGNLFVTGDAVTGSQYSAVYIYPLASPGSPTSITGFNGNTPPYALALDSNNNLYVSDTGNHQVEEFTYGNYSHTPTTISFDGPLFTPEGIAVDSSNNVYVVDSTNGSLNQYVP